MRKMFPDLPEWNFELDEVSAGVYKVVGIDRSGHMLSATGIDIEELIEQCKKDALAITQQSAI